MSFKAINIPHHWCSTLKPEILVMTPIFCLPAASLGHWIFSRLAGSRSAGRDIGYSVYLCSLSFVFILTPHSSLLNPHSSILTPHFPCNNFNSASHNLRPSSSRSKRNPLSVHCLISRRTGPKMIRNSVRLSISVRMLPSSLPSSIMP